MAKASELRDRSNEDLKEMVEGLKAEIFNARFQRHTEQLESTALLKEKKRDLARVLTILKERSLESNNGE